MIERTIRFRSLDSLSEKAWETMDFTAYDKASKKIDFQLMQLSRELRAGTLDCVWFRSSHQRIVWTRSLKHKDTIQISSLDESGKKILANGDVQADTYKDLLRESAPIIYKGATVHTLAF